MQPKPSPSHFLIFDKIIGLEVSRLSSISKSLITVWVLELKYTGGEHFVPPFSSPYEKLLLKLFGF